MLIAGSGPAGAATALTLRKMAPALRIAIADPAPKAVRIGEGLPPPAGPMLKELGLWDAFIAQGHLEAHQTQAVWGAARRHANSYLFLGKGKGWTLDRPAFDGLLRRRAFAAADEGIAGRLTGLRRLGVGWRARVADQVIDASAVVDATGRAATVSRRLGIRPLLADRLIAVVAAATVPHCGERGILVEASPDGWWYTAPTHSHRRIWVWLTDSDIFRATHARDPSRCLQALQGSPNMARLANGAKFDQWRLVPAMTQDVLLPTDASPYLTVGDAASCFDPASSQGISKALRSGIFAGYALHDYLIKGKPEALRRHRVITRAEFRAYRHQHHRHYAAERRWADRPFWLRRHTSTSMSRETPS